ncbi:uncharacterized protein LOC122201735 [Panthera leo]|uniref:uncharacterized protein LOC122201735 n=1 Tax=Panthera leo TaxID=9689 RepID=UPI001C69C642|nr:uncharacterized protein LOC122201735 [Panthera leo]
MSCPVETSDKYNSSQQTCRVLPHSSLQTRQQGLTCTTGLPCRRLPCCQHQKHFCSFSSLSSNASCSWNEHLTQRSVPGRSFWHLLSIGSCPHSQLPRAGPWQLWSSCSVSSHTMSREQLTGGRPPPHGTGHGPKACNIHPTMGVITLPQPLVPMGQTTKWRLSPHNDPCPYPHSPCVSSQPKGHYHDLMFPGHFLPRPTGQFPGSFSCHFRIS